MEKWEMVVLGKTVPESRVLTEFSDESVLFI